MNFKISKWRKYKGSKYILIRYSSIFYINSIEYYVFEVIESDIADNVTGYTIYIVKTENGKKYRIYDKNITNADYIVECRNLIEKDSLVECWQKGKWIYRTKKEVIDELSKIIPSEIFNKMVLINITSLPERFKNRLFKRIYEED